MSINRCFASYFDFFISFIISSAIMYTNISGSGKNGPKYADHFSKLACCKISMHPSDESNDSTKPAIISLNPPDLSASVRRNSIHKTAIRYGQRILCVISQYIAIYHTGKIYINKTVFCFNVITSLKL